VARCVAPVLVDDIFEDDIFGADPVVCALTHAVPKPANAKQLKRITLIKAQ